VDREEPWYAELRRQWKPDPVRLLLIGESAPSDAGDPSARRFFYADNLSGRDNLFRAVVEAVLDEPHLDSQTETKSRWLAQLHDRGVFLIDLVPHPVNGMEGVERRHARKTSVSGCVERAAALAPEGIIVCHKPSFELLRVPLLAAGLPLLHDTAIPFPLGNWRRDFVQGFRAAYGKLEDAQTEAAPAGG